MIICCDIETTGFPNYGLRSDDPSQPHIVEFAAILCEDDGKVRNQFSYLIQPSGYEIPEEVVKVHGITTELAKRHGVPLDLALRCFWQFCFADHPEPLPPSSLNTLVAHNVVFEAKMIRIAYSKLGLEQIILDMPMFCTMEHSTDICQLPRSRGKGKFKFPKLSEAHQILCGREFSNAHTALADAHACRRLYFAIQRIKKEKAQEGLVIPSGVYVGDHFDEKHVGVY